MKRIKILIKLLYIHFLFCTVFLFASCPSPSDRIPEHKPSHPGDIVTDVGTLKYIRTLWDMDEIYDGQKIDNEIWIFAHITSGVQSLYKGMDKSVSMPISFVKEKISYACGETTRMLPKGDYINFIVGNVYTGSRNSTFYIARVHRATMALQYIRIPKLDGRYWPSAYCGNNDDVFFRHNDNGKYYMLNDACDNVIEITEQEFHDLYSPGLDYVTDDEGRYYRLTYGFAVSVDNGKTWHENTLEGSFPRGNAPKSIITQDDSIFILCSPVDYHLSDWWGGGIHEFKWETEGGEE